MILLDVTPVPGGLGMFASVAFLLIFLAIAIVVFKLLKRTMKMAFRLIIVGVIIAIALAGSVFFLMLGTPKPVRPLPHSQQR
jgi:hypothetical protein